MRMKGGAEVVRTRGNPGAMRIRDSEGERLFHDAGERLFHDLPLPLREGVGGRGPIRSDPLPPTPSRKGRGRSLGI